MYTGVAITAFAGARSMSKHGFLCMAFQTDILPVMCSSMQPKASTCAPQINTQPGHTGSVCLRMHVSVIIRLCMRVDAELCLCMHVRKCTFSTPACPEAMQPRLSWHHTYIQAQKLDDQVSDNAVLLALPDLSLHKGIKLPVWGVTHLLLLLPQLIQLLYTHHNQDMFSIHTSGS